MDAKFDAQVPFRYKGFKFNQSNYSLGYWAIKHTSSSFFFMEPWKENLMLKFLLDIKALNSTNQIIRLDTGLSNTLSVVSFSWNLGKKIHDTYPKWDSSRGKHSAVWLTRIAMVSRKRNN